MNKLKLLLLLLLTPFLSMGCIGTYDNIELLDSFGFGSVSPAVSYILRPISYDLARANAIETNDLVRKNRDWEKMKGRAIVWYVYHKIIKNDYENDSMPSMWRRLPRIKKN